MCEHSDRIINSVLDSSVDIGIILYPASHRHLELQTLWSSRYLLVCSPSLLLPDCPFSPETAGRFTFINMSWPPDFSAWQEHHYQTRIYPYQTSRIFLYLSLLIHGLGVGFLPKRIAAPYIKTGQLREIPFLHSEEAPRETGYLIYLTKKQKILQPYFDKFSQIKSALYGHS